MKLHSSLPSGVNTITGYGEGYVLVNGQRRESSVVVLPERVESWPAKSFDALTAEIAKAGIGLEVMDLQAACRTYNILVAEERKVAAALLFE